MTPTDTYILYSEQKPKPEDFPIVAKRNNIGVDTIYVIAHYTQLGGYPTPKFWAPFREPAMPPEPKKTPFEEWRDKNRDAKSRDIWTAGEAHGRSEERKRFSEGVEKVNANWTIIPGYSIDNLWSDIRSLADGEEAT